MRAWMPCVLPCSALLQLNQLHRQNILLCNCSTRLHMPVTRSLYLRRRSFTNWPRPWRYSWLVWPPLDVISKSEINVLGIMVKYIDIPAYSLLYFSARTCYLQAGALSQGTFARPRVLFILKCCQIINEPGAYCIAIHWTGRQSYL